MAEQEFVRAYQRTLASGKTIQVTAHNRTNADIGTAARKQPGRPPLSASGGTLPLGRSLPGIWVMPHPEGASAAAQAQSKVRKDQQDAKAWDEADKERKKLLDRQANIPAEKLNQLGKHPGTPGPVAEYARQLGKLNVRSTTRPTKATSVQSSKFLAQDAPPAVQAYAKKLGLSATTRNVVDKLVQLTAGTVHVDTYTRRTRSGRSQRVRQYVRRQDLSPDMGAKKGTYSSVGSAKPAVTPPKVGRRRWQGHYEELVTRSGGGWEQHAVVAFDQNNKARGILTWLGGHRADETINSLWVDPDFRRQGLATAMLEKARSIVPTLGHSAERSDAGNLFAQSTGDDVHLLPKRRKRESVQDAEQEGRSNAHVAEQQYQDVLIGAKHSTYITPEIHDLNQFPEITRDQFSNPDTPRTRGVTPQEFQAITLRGQKRFNQLLANFSKPEALYGDGWQKMKDQGWDSVQSEWGGITADARTGKLVKDDGADQFAMTIKPAGMNSVSIPVGASREEFDSAMEQAKKKFANQLRIGQAHLGVFRDDAVNRIDIDPVLIVDNLDDVETIGAYTRNVGGAYNFRDGNGYWPPYVIQGPDNGRREETARLPQGSGSVASPGSGGTGESPPGGTASAAQASPEALGWEVADKGSESLNRVGLSVHVGGYARRMKDGKIERVRPYIRGGHASIPNLGARTGTYSRVHPVGIAKNTIGFALQANPRWDRNLNLNRLMADKKLGSFTSVSPEYGYNLNCANAITAFEIRLRGSNVTARPVVNLAKETDEDFILSRFHHVDTGRPLVVRDLAKTKTRAKTEALVKSWPNGARGLVLVEWKKDNGHYFVALNYNGEVRWLNPQDGTHLPERLFDNVNKGRIYVHRIDDMVIDRPEDYVQ